MSRALRFAQRTLIEGSTLFQLTALPARHGTSAAPERLRVWRMSGKHRCQW